MAGTGRKGSERNGSLRQLRVRAAYLVLSVFTVALGVDMLSITYEVPPGLIALTAVVGVWLYGVRPSGGSQDDEANEP